jgi:hypothetical protein
MARGYTAIFLTISVFVLVEKNDVTQGASRPV